MGIINRHLNKLGHTLFRPLLLTIVAAGGLLTQSTEKPAQERGSVPFSYLGGEPMHIGNEIQFLMDDYIVEDRWKLTRKAGSVVKHLRNPILVGDKPWEGATIGGAPSILYDDKLRKYRMWYQCFDLTNYFTREGPAYYIGYAESDEGFNWTKPALEGFPLGNYPRTNIVTTGRGGRPARAGQVLTNPDQSNPQKRFIMVYVGAGVDLAYSPDGFHWNIVEKPLLPYHSDCPNHLVWIAERQLWFLYGRPSVLSNGRTPLPEGLTHTGRRLSLSTSKDLENWSQPR